MVIVLKDKLQREKKIKKYNNNVILPLGVSSAQQQQHLPTQTGPLIQRLQRIRER